MWPGPVHCNEGGEPPPPPGDSRTGNGSAQAPGLSKSESRERHTHTLTGARGHHCPSRILYLLSVNARRLRLRAGARSAPAEEIQAAASGGPSVERVNLGTQYSPVQAGSGNQGSLQAGLIRSHWSQAGGVAHISFCRRGSVRQEGGAARKGSGTENQTEAQYRAPARAEEHPV